MYLEMHRLKRRRCVTMTITSTSATLVLLPVEKLQKLKTSNSKHGAHATLVTEHASTDAGLLLHCSDDDDWTPGYPEAVLVHHFAGSWKNDDQQPHTALQAAVQGPVPEEGPLYR